MLGNYENYEGRKKMRPFLTGTAKVDFNFYICPLGIVLRTVLPTARLRIEVGGLGLRNKAVNQNFNAIKNLLIVLINPCWR